MIELLLETQIQHLDRILRFILSPLISPPNVPIPVVEPADTNGYWTVTTSSSSRIDMTWWTADVSPQETLTNDLDVLSINLFNVEYVIGLDVVVTYPDSNLALLSAPAGWPATEKSICPYARCSRT